MAKQYAVSDDEPATFIAYYGTTLENYRTCAQVTNAGIVLVKTRKSTQGEPETISFVYGLIAGANYAFLRAKKLGHTPIILEGELYRYQYYSRGELFPREAFPVNRAWIPREYVDWRTYNRFADAFVEEALETHRVFEPKNPRSLLSQEILR